MEHETEQDIAQISALLHDKLGVRAGSLRAAVHKARRRLPRSIYRQAVRLAEAEPLASHPKLRVTLDQSVLAVAVEQVRAYLEAIDPADRRKGWWLGMMGGMAFNILALAVLLVLFLRWRGFI